MKDNKVEEKSILYWLLIDGEYYFYSKTYEPTNEGEKFHSLCIRRDYDSKVIAFDFKDERGLVILENEIYRKIIETLEEYSQKKNHENCTRRN